MTTTNAELRALAQAARMDATNWYDLDMLHNFLLTDDTLACGPFIVEASPARIIELLSQLDSRDEQLKDQVEHIGKWESRAHQAEDALKTDSARRQNKLEIAMRALEFYADHQQWNAAAYEDVDCAADEDRGETARHALAQLKEQP